MTNKKSREESIEDLTLALMYLTSFSDVEGRPSNEMFWKNYDFNTINRLDEKELILDPKQKRGRSKYAYMTEAGRKKAKELLNQWGIKDKEIYEQFEFRTIASGEYDLAADIVMSCFSANEAGEKDVVIESAKVAPDYFLVAVEKKTEKVVGVLNGVATNEYRFRDEFFTDLSLHDPNGKNIMLTNLAVLPEYRKQGVARELMYTYCRKQEERGTRDMVLTCVANKVKMYRKMGFHEVGEANSFWGGHKWKEMQITLNYGFDYEED